MECVSTDLQIRWLIRSDYDAILAIEQLSFEEPWTEGDFLDALRQRHCIGMVAESRDEAGHYCVQGYMIYELHPKQLKLISMAVHPDCRRMGVGSAMISKLATKSVARRATMIVDVWERNLPGQLFLQANGFQCISILRRMFGGDDAYRMMFNHERISDDSK